MPLSPVTLSVADNGDSAAINYTITGTTPTATNTLYVASWSGAIGSSAATLLDQSGTGDLTAEVVALAPGYYWFFVLSTLGSDSAVSNMAYQNVADLTAEAVQTRIITAIRAKLLALNLSGIGTNVFALPTMEELSVAMPSAVIARDPTSPQTEVGGNNARDDIQYSFLVAFRVADQLGMSSPVGTYDLWVEKASRAFRNQRLEDVPECVVCKVEGPRSPDPVPAFFNQVVSALTVKVVCRERRGV